MLRPSSEISQAKAPFCTGLHPLWGGCKKGRAKHLQSTHCVPGASKPSGPEISFHAYGNPEKQILQLPLTDGELKPREGVVCPGSRSTYVLCWDAFLITVCLSSGLIPFHPSP